MTSSSTSSDHQLRREAQEIFRPTICSGEVRHPITTINPEQKNPRKKRTKKIRLKNMNAIVGGGVGSSGSHSRKPKYIKKPDPNAPEITGPCSECGRKFWSSKALYGHVRCHPERPWRGINPPPNLHHTPPLMAADDNNPLPITTEDHLYIASCLIMLSKAPATSFECISCKRVFGSHQALGGHRASHKNVKGCFAITRNEGGVELEEGEIEGHFENKSSNNNMNMMMVLGSSSEHKCSICSRVFPSGQALGGHKRCHWEKDDGVVPVALTSVLSPSKCNLDSPFRFDLNLPAPREDYSSSSTLCLDLRLGL